MTILIIERLWLLKTATTIDNRKNVWNRNHIFKVLLYGVFVSLNHPDELFGALLKFASGPLDYVCYSS